MILKHKIMNEKEISRYTNKILFIERVQFWPDYK